MAIKLLDKFLDGNGSALVIATGDYVINAEGDTPTDPLRVPLLVQGDGNVIAEMEIQLRGAAADGGIISADDFIL